MKFISLTSQYNAKCNIETHIVNPEYIIKMTPRIKDTHQADWFETVIDLVNGGGRLEVNQTINEILELIPEEQTND